MFTEIAKVYVNGVLANNPTTVNVNDLQGQDQARIGQRGADNSWCNCDVAEVEIYSRVLSDSEILHIFSRFEPECGE